MSTLLIKNCYAVLPEKEKEEKCSILVEDGKIKELYTHVQEADKVIDGENLVAVPGFVDIHVHLRDPGQTQKEDIITGCKAAAAGGVTSLLAMPNR